MPATMDIDTALKETRAYLGAIAEAHGEDPPELDEQLLREVLAGLLEQTDGQDLDDVEELHSYSAGPHKYASTQLNLPEDVASRVLALSAKIPDDELADDGREEEPHVTALYGLHGSDPDEVRELVRDFGPVPIVLGKTSIFPDSGKGYDVVKIDVTGERLQELHDLLASPEHTDTHPEYRPHVTLAYVQAGEGKRYARIWDDAMEGVKLTLSELVFSDQDGKRTIIPLDGGEPVSYALQQGERYASQWPGPGWTYAGKGQRGGKKWKRGKQAASGDENSLLAEHIAEWWNAHGEPSEEDMDAAAAELDGTGWGVWLNAESEQWEAVKLDDAGDLPDDALVVYAAERAPKGGVEIGGKHYRGGQWIPSAVVASAAPEVKSRITKAANVHKERVKGRMATREQVKGRVAKHKDKALTPRQQTQAKQMLAQLIAHHGEHVVSRLDEIAEQTQAMLDGITEANPNDVLQGQLETKLAQLHAMTGMVEERKHGEEYEEAAKKAKQPEKPKEKKVFKESKKARTGDSLYKIIQDGGGINLAELRNTHDVKVEFIEAGLRGLLRDPSKVTNAAGQHHVKGLDQWAETLQNEGRIQVPGSVNATEHLLNELKSHAKSLRANIDNEIDRMAKQYYKEKENAEREAGAERVAETLRDSEAAGVSQAEEEADRGSLGELADEEGADEEAGDFEFGLNVQEKSPESAPKSDQQTLTQPTGVDTITSSGETPTGGKAMDGTTTSDPHTMTAAEFHGQAVSKTPAKRETAKFRGTNRDGGVKTTYLHSQTIEAAAKGLSALFHTGWGDPNADQLAPASKGGVKPVKMYDRDSGKTTTVSDVIAEQTQGAALVTAQEPGGGGIVGREAVYALYPDGTVKAVHADEDGGSNEIRGSWHVFSDVPPAVVEKLKVLAHYNAVRSAVAAGKEVSPAVLADYPDLGPSPQQPTVRVERE